MDHRASRGLQCLPDGLRHLVRLSRAHAHLPLLIAYGHQCSAGETPAALHDLRYAVDVNDVLLQVGLTWSAPATSTSATALLSCHATPLELEAALAGALCESLHATVI